MECKPSSLGPANGLSQVGFYQFLLLLTLSYIFPFLHMSANFLLSLTLWIIQTDRLLIFFILVGR